ncbi:MAG: hypothetical protein ACRDI2_14180, partial [Chloroflexota bacterium]
LLAREALEYGLVSSETAFVAVRKEAGKPVEGTVAVANALPAGWSESFLSGVGGVGMAIAGASSFPAGGMADRASGGLLHRLVAPLARRPPGTGQTVRDASFRATADSGGAYPRPRSRPRSGPRPATGAVVFSGTLSWDDGSAILFDTAREEDATKLPDGATLSSIRLQFLGQPPDPGSLDRRLSLLLFVDDLSSPRARVRLSDLLRQGGERPLHLLRSAGQRVQLILTGASGAEPTALPPVEVRLAWD